MNYTQTKKLTDQIMALSNKEFEQRLGRILSMLKPDEDELSEGDVQPEPPKPLEPEPKTNQQF